MGVLGAPGTQRGASPPANRQQECQALSEYVAAASSLRVWPARPWAGPRHLQQERSYTELA